MKRRTKITKALDAKHHGEEPDLRGKVDRIDFIKAYNWYSYNCDADQAKAWVIEYLKEFHKTEKELIKNANKLDGNLVRTCGWNCRILLLGGSLPEAVIERTLAKVRHLAASGGSTGRREEAPSGEAEARTEGEADGAGVSAKPVISIQERVTNRANDLIAEIEVLIDNYYRDGTVFKPSDWLSQHDVKPAIAQRIADHYKPLYSEAFDALNGKDDQLKEGYSRWKKTKLKLYVEFLRSIVSAAETRAVVVKAARKPRKKKEKPASALVAKLRYKEKDDTYKIVSVDPKQIIGSNQVWVFNTKYRTLAVYNAMGPAGISVKGSTLLGFDEKTSIIKKLRKPEAQLKSLIDGGKVVLRKFMDGIKCKPKAATGRINNECILVRIIR